MRRVLLIENYLPNKGTVNLQQSTFDTFKTNDQCCCDLSGTPMPQKRRVPRQETLAASRRDMPPAKLARVAEVCMDYGLSMMLNICSSLVSMQIVPIGNERLLQHLPLR